MPVRLLATGYPPWAKVLLDESANEPLPRNCLACNRERGWPMCRLCQRLTNAEREAARD